MRLLLAGVLCVLLAGCGASGGEKDQPVEGPREVPVTVLETKSEDVVFSSSKVGAANVNRQVSINFSSPGRLEEFLVEEDQYVRKGEPIARLDDTELRARVETTRLKVAELGRRKTKLSRMLEKGVVTEAEYDPVETAYLTAQETLKVAEDKLAKVVVTAPFSGLLLKRIMEVGSFVPPAAPVAVLVDVDKIRVDLDLSDREIGKVTVGTSVAVHTDAYTGRDFAAKIARIVPAVDPRSRMTRVELEIENPGRLLRPGMMVRTDIVVGSFRKVISLPVDCLVYQGKLTFVFVIDGSTHRAERRNVTIGTLYQDRAIITKGLVAGELVVETGQSYLSEGTAVRILQ